MSKKEMPATEASESASYELAFHVLPTVAEGEVPAVFEKIKTALTNNGAELTDEEAPKRFDLAYDIVKYLEGRNRKFSSAYFGWVRFTLPVTAIDKTQESIKEISELLRHLLIKLDKVEEAFPYRFHEGIEAKHVEAVDENEDEDDSEASVEADTPESDDDGEETK